MAMIQEQILLQNLLNSKGLIHQYDKLNTIFNSVREIIFTVDLATGFIEDINDSITKIGYEKEEWEKKSFKDWPLETKKYFCHWLGMAAKVLQKPAAVKCLFRLKAQIKWCLMSSQLCFTASMERIICSAFYAILPRTKNYWQIWNWLYRKKEN